MVVAAALMVIRDNLNSIYVRGAAVRVVDPGTTPY
jgi:hypothetical protein